jgi:hypothetical protein
MEENPMHRNARPILLLAIAFAACAGAPSFTVIDPFTY